MIVYKVLRETRDHNLRSVNKTNLSIRYNLEGWNKPIHGKIFAFVDKESAYAFCGIGRDNPKYFKDCHWIFECAADESPSVIHILNSTSFNRNMKQCNHLSPNKALKLFWSDYAKYLEYVGGCDCSRREMPIGTITCDRIILVRPIHICSYYDNHIPYENDLRRIGWTQSSLKSPAE